MCGFVGIVSNEPVANAIYLGLHTLQHRGQDAAGIATFHHGEPHIHKDTGLVTQVFPDGASALEGNIGVGHVRYPTWGGKGADEAQPYLNRIPRLLMAHNGTVKIPGESHACNDSAYLADEISRLTSGGASPVGVATHLIEKVEGAFSVVYATPNELVGIRDAHAIRPLVYGRRGDSWMIASETVALETLGFTDDVTHLSGGSCVVLRTGQEPVVETIYEAPARRCVFERIYLARPDSHMEDGLMMRQRGRLGQQLALEWPADIQADVVVPIPDTSRPAATAMAEVLGLPCREGLIKNRYSGRTFIMPDQASRDQAIRLKLNAVREVFEGRRVILVDDSIVRGTTMRQIVQMVWQCDPKEVHVAVMSPPVRHPCSYGINMSTYSELVASGIAPEEVSERLREEFGATSVTYLTVEGMYEVVSSDICAACFDGKSPLR